LIQLYSELTYSTPLTTSQANVQQTIYIQQYLWGNISSYGNPNVSWNRISNADWQVFPCGVGKIAQVDFTDCINSF